MVRLFVIILYSAAWFEGGGLEGIGVSGVCGIVESEERGVSG
jgi:hypothetical protein